MAYQAFASFRRKKSAPPRRKKATRPRASKTAGDFRNEKNVLPRMVLADANGAPKGSVVNWLNKILAVDVSSGAPKVTVFKAAVTWVRSPVLAAAATWSAADCEILLAIAW